MRGLPVAWEAEVFHPFSAAKQKRQNTEYQKQVLNVTIKRCYSYVQISKKKIPVTTGVPGGEGTAPLSLWRKTIKTIPCPKHFQRTDFFVVLGFIFKGWQVALHQHVPAGSPAAHTAPVSLSPREEAQRADFSLDDLRLLGEAHVLFTKLSNTR